MLFLCISVFKSWVHWLATVDTFGLVWNDECCHVLSEEMWLNGSFGEGWEIWLMECTVCPRPNEHRSAFCPLHFTALGCVSYFLAHRFILMPWALSFFHTKTHKLIQILHHCMCWWLKKMMRLFHRLIISFTLTPNHVLKRKSSCQQFSYRVIWNLLSNSFTAVFVDIIRSNWDCCCWVFKCHFQCFEHHKWNPVHVHLKLNGKRCWYVLTM